MPYKNVMVLHDKAFMVMLAAAVDAFPFKYMGSRRPAGGAPEGEVYGLLYGRRKRPYAGRRVFEVSLAVPLQYYERKDDNGFIASMRHYERTKNLLDCFPGLEFLGSFHTHPWRADEFDRHAAAPSEEDEETFRSDCEDEGKDTVHAILAITYGRRKPRGAQRRIQGKSANYNYVVRGYLSRLKQPSV